MGWALDGGHQARGAQGSHGWSWRTAVEQVVAEKEASMGAYKLIFGLYIC